MRTHAVTGFMAEISLCCAITCAVSYSQPGSDSCITPQTRARVVVFQSGGWPRDTLWFGYHPLATYCIDSNMCGENGSAHWGIARWLPHPALCPKHPRFDYVAFRGPATIDTSLIKLELSVPPGYPAKFKWLRTEVAAICDSCILMDAFGGLIVPRTNMVLRDSLQVNTPAITELWMIRYGQRLTGVKEDREERPRSFALNQNYPNPFNPATTLSFTIPYSSLVILKVYDVLGREVATLVNDHLTPGTYTKSFNADGLTSGVHIYRLTTPSATVAKKMLLLH